MKELRNMRIHVVSLGCAKNRVDTEKALAILERQGCKLTDNPEEADCILINSCGFIGGAREETVDTVLELAQYKERNSSVKLAVMGCMVERFGLEMEKEMPEIDYLIPLTDKGASGIYDPDNTARKLPAGSISAYLKIAEGCGNSCTFCSIPLIRGPLKSRPMEAIIEEAEKLAASGIKELVLVAQDTTRYGADLKMDRGLVTLLEKLLKCGLDWIRVMYAFPPLLNRELMELIASEPAICSYIDVPFQHIDDDILKAMGRRETESGITELLGEIRRIMPQGAVRSSFIVGFPGETEEKFKRLENFIGRAGLDHAGVFTFSPEKGTKAAGLAGTVPEEVKLERKDRLMEIQSNVSLQLNRQKVGKRFPVLVERYNDGEGLLLGRLETQAPEVDGEVILNKCNANPGEMVEVKITKAMEYDLVGEPV